MNESICPIQRDENWCLGRMRRRQEIVLVGKCKPTIRRFAVRRNVPEVMLHGSRNDTWQRRRFQAKLRQEWHQMVDCVNRTNIRIVLHLMGQKDIERTVQILKHLLETGEIDPAVRIKAEEKVRILQEELEKLSPVKEKRKTALSGDGQHHKEPALTQNLGQCRLVKRS
jgi:hypothetical protein